MKKTFALLLALLLCAGLLAACGGGATPAATDGSGAAASGPVDLRVVTSFGANDGGRGVYEAGYKAWEAETGNTVKDESAMSNEAWKAQVIADFATGSEPDVLFFFNGVDSNTFVEPGKVVSIEEIRAEYPEYATNMKDEAMGSSPYDGKNYSVPTAGYWEALFVNKDVLEAANVEMPTANTTWEEFLQICEQIKTAGYTPIAVSLNEVPHYWFEYCVLNNGGRATHETIPSGSDDPIFSNWVAGLEDIKELYDLGYLPKNTNTMSDDDAFDMMANDEAAFALDGSWKMNWFAGYTDADSGEFMPGHVDDLENYTVTFVPGKGERKSTEMIGGLSMGYYITRKAWDDPAKRDAAVSFVMHMTTDEIVNEHAGGTAITALKNGTQPPEDPNSLVLAALDMLQESTGTVAAVQDNLTGDAKQVLLPDNMKLVVTGEITPAESIEQALAKM